MTGSNPLLGPGTTIRTRPLWAQCAKLMLTLLRSLRDTMWSPVWPSVTWALIKRASTKESLSTERRALPQLTALMPTGGSPSPSWPSVTSSTPRPEKTALPRLLLCAIISGCGSPEPCSTSWLLPSPPWVTPVLSTAPKPEWYIFQFQLLSYLSLILIIVILILPLFWICRLRLPILNSVQRNRMSKSSPAGTVLKVTAAVSSLARAQ